MRKSSVIVMMTLALSTFVRIGAGAIVEDFQALASDPVWQAPDNGWQFLTDSNGAGTVGALTGSVVPGGPSGKYGNFAGTGNDNSAVTHANDVPLSGTFSFDAIFNDDPQVGLVGQDRFWLGPNRGAAPNDRRPQFYINKSSTAGAARLQLNRGDNSYVDFNGFNLGTWYNYNIAYDFPAGTWDLEIKTLGGATVFNEAGNYTIDVANNQLAAFATWEVRYGINGTGKSMAWNIDNINVPEPATATIICFGMGALLAIRKLGRRGVTRKINPV
jgi:hypothetical protein